MTKKLHIKLGFIFLLFLLAGLYSGNSLEFVSWVLVVFVSVLFHELGHALTAQAFGKSTLIELSFFGGTTYFRPEGLKKWQLFLISLNGPLFGLLLFFLSNVLLFNLSPDSKLIYACKISSFINLFWTLFNLLPILPLDGGQLLRVTLESVFKNKGLYYTGIASCIFSVTLALIGFLLGQFFIGAILFLFAFQNYELVKQARYLSTNDQEESYRRRLQEAVYLYETGQLDKVEPLLKELRHELKSGMIFNQATALSVMIMKSHKDYKGIYECLKTSPKLYENDLASLMHEAAYFVNDMPLVEKLSSEAFQRDATAHTAFRSAVAASALKNEEATLGWLKTALELGINEDEIKTHPMLKAYTSRLNL